METIKVHFEYSKDYRLISATGGWGGVSPNGEIILELYIERKAAPKSISMDVDESGKTTEKTREGEKFIRELQIGVVMRPDIALSIGEFLVSKAKSIRKS